MVEHGDARGCSIEENLGYLVLIFSVRKLDMVISGVTLLAFTTHVLLSALLHVAIAVKRIWEISWQFLARHFITLGRDESTDLCVDAAQQFAPVRVRE